MKEVFIVVGFQKKAGSDEYSQTKVFMGDNHWNNDLEKALKFDTYEEAAGKLITPEGDEISYNDPALGSCAFFQVQKFYVKGK